MFARRHPSFRRGLTSGAVLALIATAAVFGGTPSGGRAAQGPTEFTSTTSMVMADGASQPSAGNPYPSSVVVSGFNQSGAVIDEVSVKLTGLKSGEAANDPGSAHQIVWARILSMARAWERPTPVAIASQIFAPRDCRTIQRPRRSTTFSAKPAGDG